MRELAELARHYRMCQADTDKKSLICRVTQLKLECPGSFDASPFEFFSERRATQQNHHNHVSLAMLDTLKAFVVKNIVLRHTRGSERVCLKEDAYFVSVM